MRLQDYDQRDGKQVWLSQDEVQRLIDAADGPEQQRAFKLGARCGLRRSEIVSVTVADFQHGPEGFLRVWEDYAKLDQSRETPVPHDLETVVVDSLAYRRDADAPVVDVDGSTVYRWVRRAAEQLQAETGDEGWSYLDVHDLRRTWGGDLLWNQGLMPSTVMAFGGWQDWATFREHYLGEMSPEAARRERAKVSWMGKGESTEVDRPASVFEPSVPTRGYGGTTGR